MVGGSHGVGLAVAELLAGQGADVVVNGRDADAAAEAAQRIHGAIAFAGSPADPEVADALIETCIQQFGRIDILVNCAGTAGLASESILKVTSAQFRELLDAHLGTTFETCRAAAPKMVKQRGGSIANVVCPGAKTRLSTGSEYEAHIVELKRRGLLDEASVQARRRRCLATATTTTRHRGRSMRFRPCSQT